MWRQWMVVPMLGIACGGQPDVGESDWDVFEGEDFDDSLQGVPLAEGPQGPPTGGTLSSSTWQQGEEATISVHDLEPGMNVYFLLARGGAGTSCPAILRGNCVDILQPKILGRGVANIEGTARMSLNVPRSFGRASVLLQAVGINPSNVYITNSSNEPISPAGSYAIPPCNINDVDLDWPMPGTDGEDWVINNYVDLNPTSGVTDFLGNGKSYDGHNGIDIDVPTFREMDADFPILSSTWGEVVDIREDQFDRNTACTGSWNFVQVEHANGFNLWYGHLKKDSVTVNIGDTVAPGDVIGVVGSSGCSTHPHLHLEIHDCDDRVVEPFLEGMWNLGESPVYATAPSVMDAVIRLAAISTSTPDIKDPWPNAPAAGTGDQIGVGVSFAGGTTGDVLTLEVRTPSGSLWTSGNANIGNMSRHSFWWWNPTLGSTVGSWQIRLLVNGVLDWSQRLEVASTGAAQGPDQRVYWEMSASEYQSVFNAETGVDWRPSWVDVYDDGGSGAYNAVFVPDDGAAWAAWHDADGTTHDTNLNNWAGVLSPIHVDGAYTSGGMRYTGIMVAPNSGWASWYGLPDANHTTTFDDAVNTWGLHLANAAVGWTGSARVWTTLYDDVVPSYWVHGCCYDATAYQTEFDSHWALGRIPAYIDAHNDGVPRFSASWDNTSWSSAGARHIATEATLASELPGHLAAGRRVEVLTGYLSAGSPRWAYTAVAR